MKIIITTYTDGEILKSEPYPDHVAKQYVDADRRDKKRKGIKSIRVIKA